MSLMRYWFSAPLVSTSPLHSSGLDEEVDRTPDLDQERTAVPRSFSRTVDGIPSLSGRSVKGALRSAMTRCFPSEEERFKPLWGSLDAASPLTIHPIALSDVCTGENLLLRDGIAVDRYWGTVGHGALFQHEVAPAGVPLLLSISAQASSRPDIEGGVSPRLVEDFFAHLSALLDTGRLAFGGRRSVGWGRVKLKDDTQVSCRRADLGSRKGLIALHRGGDDVELDFVPRPPASDRISIDIAWTSPSGILIASGAFRDEGAPDAPEITRPLHMNGAASPFVIPGSSIRGALRARCSRIARTIIADGDERQIDDWSDLEVHEQLRRDPVLVRILFGDSGVKGALSVLDTLAQGCSSKRQTHNAGDRFSGGVVDGLLYTEEIPDDGWNEIRLEIDTALLARLDSPDQDPDYARAALCLLGLALAELASGALAIGSRGTRGLGEVRMKALTVDGPEELIGQPWRISSTGDPRGTAEEILARLQGINELLPSGGWSLYLHEGNGQ